MTTAKELLEKVVFYGTLSDSKDHWRIPYGLRVEIQEFLSQPPRELSKRFVKPSPEEVTSYAKSIDFDLIGQVFTDFYESKGWKVGKTPMKDWKAAVRTWKRSDEQKKKPVSRDGKNWASTY
jgi:hypothetical protein